MTKGQVLLGDKAYDANWLRALVAEKGARANIPPKTLRKGPIAFSQRRYKQRHLVERARLWQATPQPASPTLNKLACIRIRLRFYESMA